MSYLKLAAGFCVMLIGGVIALPILILLLPFRKLRILWCNFIGHTFFMWTAKCSGIRLTIKGLEAATRNKPAIFVANHSSVLDLLLVPGIAPYGTVAISKDTIVRYPIVGQIYYLSGSITIDRSNRESAIQGMKKLGDYVRAENLGIFMFPEGTRSKDGRLSIFKKGFVHLAIATGLPIIPVVFSGAYQAWPSRTFKLVGGPMDIEFLPPVDTASWQTDHVDTYVAQIRDIFQNALPEAQQSKIEHTT